MERKNIFITALQVEKLKELSLKTGLPVSELIRRALDEYLANWK